MNDEQKGRLAMYRVRIVQNDQNRLKSLKKRLLLRVDKEKLSLSGQILEKPSRISYKKCLMKIYFSNKRETILLFINDDDLSKCVSCMGDSFKDLAILPALPTTCRVISTCNSMETLASRYLQDLDFKRAIHRIHYMLEQTPDLHDTQENTIFHL